MFLLTFGPLPPQSVCENTKGSYTCTCRPGFNGTGCTNTNECAAGVHNCNPNALCADSSGSFTCRCNNGFTGSGVQCSLINCGSLTCGADESCVQGSQGSPAICRCNTGFVSSSSSDCVDVDECAEASHSCGAAAQCTNTKGSFSCACRPGFRLLATGLCADIDECAQNMHSCSLYVI